MVGSGKEEELHTTVLLLCTLHTGTTKDAIIIQVRKVEREKGWSLGLLGTGKDEDARPLSLPLEVVFIGGAGVRTPCPMEG